MSLALPDLTVVDRNQPYAFSYVEVPIYEREAPLLRNTSHADLMQVRSLAGPVTTRRSARSRLPDRIVRFDVNSRFATAPGDPSPFVYRDVGPVDCGALVGVAAVYCAVMSRR